MDKKIVPVMIAAFCSFLFFTILILMKGNYEFIFYLFVVFVIMFIVYKSHKKVNYPTYVLWHLLVWATLHLAGGNLTVNGTRLYDFMFFNILGDPYNILKYDQVIHIYGFFVATLTMYYVIKPLLKKNHEGWVALGVVVVMAGLGLGALNEIIEFLATLVAPNNGVGGYINNAIDLVANFIGALIAFSYLKRREKN